MLKKVNFISHSGLNLDFKIECDDLSDEDIETIAYLVSKKYKFKTVTGVPRGGLRLANSLQKYVSNEGKNLIVDDVLTTGKSMEQFKKTDNDIGVVIFSRGKCPDWIDPIFTLNWSDI